MIAIIITIFVLYFLLNIAIALSFKEIVELFVSIFSIALFFIIVYDILLGGNIKRFIGGL